MKRAMLLVVISSALALPSRAGDMPGRALTFRQRLEAQRALERVYRAHQTAAADTSTQAISQGILEGKVRSYLRMSAALEQLWHTSVTPGMLRTEVERMASHTRMPDRLRELYGALGNDSILVQECLARPSLVERLARGFFSSNPPAGAESHPSWEAWWSAHEDRFDEAAAASVATAIELPEPRGSPGLRQPDAAGITSCSPEGVWVELGHDNVPSPRYGHSAIWTGSQMIVWGGYGAIPLDSGGRYDPAIDAWYPISGLNAPSARQYHLAAWTGDRMIVWSGYGTSNASPTNTGGLYDPLTDTWTPMSSTGAPSGRTGATAVWTGTEMLVWGGYDGAAMVGDGGRYDPSSNSWSAMSPDGAPSARPNHSAVWTGDRMIIWGGGFSGGLKNDGARYDPATDTWEQMSSDGAPEATASHAAVWTGSEMIVWGGYNGSTYLNTGGRYHPATNTWDALPLSGAPTPRNGAAVIWIGGAMIVWSGLQPNGVETSDGASYDPASNSWSPLTAQNAPSPRRWPAAVWTGSRLLIWGGLHLGSPVAEGGRYDVAPGAWTPIAAYPKKGFGSVWTGTRSIVWTGSEGFTYDPATDTTTPISSVGAPSLHYGQTTVWTGSKMMVWGGDPLSYPSPGVGGIYDLATDTWTLMSQSGAPPARTGHTMVWTGARMIVWGGLYGRFGDVYTLADGYSFDPQANSWSPIAASGLFPRAHHTAVWTGSRMIIWGGVSGDIFYGYPTLNDGARYDPATDTWSSVSATGAPGSRYHHTAVWGGSRMIVWGGAACGGGPFCAPLADGARYNPATNTWLALGTAGDPPLPMSDHAAVWTGHSMIVHAGPGYGGQYTPATDSWVRVASAGAPSTQGAAVWTGYAMGVGRSLFFPDVFDDADGDGWPICDGDCNDARASIHPGAGDLCNGIDDDCSGIADDGGALLCADGQPCTSDVCGASRGCLNPAAPDGTSCSDGDACTVADSCLSGSCSPGAARDGDVDSHGDALCGGDDCDDADAGVWHPPAEVAALDAGAGTVTSLSWEDQGASAGPDTAYDLFSGLLTSAAQLDPSVGSCLMTGGPPFFDDARPDPAPGAVSWYLARARNGCGTATWGSPDADARITACP